MLVYESKISEGVWHMADNSLKAQTFFSLNLMNVWWTVQFPHETALSMQFFSPIIILYVLIYLVSYLPDV